MFIGGSKSDGNWSWSDGSPWDYEDWAVGQPDEENPNDNYLQMMSWHPHGNWNDAQDGIVTFDKYGYICQKHLDSVPITTSKPPAETNPGREDCFV